MSIFGFVFTHSLLWMIISLSITESNLKTTNGILTMSGRSLTSCSLSCSRFPKCNFFGVFEGKCVLAETHTGEHQEMWTTLHEKGSSDHAKWKYFILQSNDPAPMSAPSSLTGTSELPLINAIQSSTETRGNCAGEGKCAAARQECRPTRGPRAGEKCLFPFKYNGKTCPGPKCCNLYNDSEGSWCSTRMDADGNHIGGNYAYCVGSPCDPAVQSLPLKEITSGKCITFAAQPLTKEECKTGPYKDSSYRYVRSGSWEGYPSGCYVYTSGKHKNKIYFNEVGDDCNKETITCLCKDGCLEHGIAYPGHEVIETAPIITSTPVECQTKCADMETCNYFTWQKTNNRCWLKRSDEGRTGDNGAVSGPARCPVPPTLFKHLGCFKEGSPRAISGRMFVFEPSSTTIGKCYNTALDEGNIYFAVQYNIECYTSPNAGSTYDRYGKTTGCESGRGGRAKMDVYRIVH